VCIITAGDPLSTIEQILSILLHRNPRNGRCERFRGSHFWIKAPASIDLQLDGSRVKLDDGVPAPESTERRQKKNAEAAMLTYRFDAVPRALNVAVPCTYNGALFENGSAKEIARPAKEQNPDQDAVRAGARKSKDVQYQDPQRLDALLEHGRKVTVVGVGPDPERHTTYIVAGVTSEKKTGVSKPVAVQINHKTTLVGPMGEPLPIAFAAKLLENTVIVVEGKKSKHGVVRAKRVVVMT